MGINLSQSDDDVARQHRRSRVGHRDNVIGWKRGGGGGKRLVTVVFDDINTSLVR